MVNNQKETTCINLWNYFQNVISWVNATFIKKRTKIMKGVQWGFLYNEFKDNSFIPNDIEAELKMLISDEEVTNQKGIYSYILTRNEKFLNIRKFPEQIKLRVYEKQNGKCNMCKNLFNINEMDADHIKKWKDGGKTEEKNCQVLCIPCNRGG